MLVSLILCSLLSYCLFKDWFRNKRRKEIVYPKICGLFSLEECIYLDNYFNSFDWDLLMVSEPGYYHSTNKERVESLEVGLDGLQDGIHRMELGMANKLSQLEAILNRIYEVLFSNKESTIQNS